MKKFNYEDLLFIDYKKCVTEILFLIVIITLLVISFNYYAYSSFNCEAFYNDELLSITVLYDDADVISLGSKLKIDDEIYSYEVMNYGEVFAVGNYYYQQINLKIDLNFSQNQVIDLTILYDYEKMIDKLLNLIF